MAAAGKTGISFEWNDPGSAVRGFIKVSSNKISSRTRTWLLPDDAYSIVLRSLVANGLI